MKLNLVICICAVLVGVCSFIATNSAAALAILVVVVASPIASIIMGKISANKTKYNFSLQKAAIVGQDLFLEVFVNRSASLRGRIDLSFECRNLATGVKKEVNVGLLPAAKEEVFLIPLDTQCCGVVSITLSSVRCCDSMGFVSTVVSGVHFSSTYTVYPVIYDLGIMVAQADNVMTVGPDYNRNKKGQDQTEVFDLQPFHEGDSLKRIHWKVSARFDQFMVRIPSAQADYDLSLFCALQVGDVQDEEHIKVFNATLSLMASISLGLLHQGQAHNILYRSGEAIESKQVENRATFDEVLDLLMTVPHPKEITSNLSISVVNNWEKHLTAKTVLITNFVPEVAMARLAEKTDLSIFYVGEKSHIAVEAKEKYRLSYLSAESIGKQVKNLEL